MSCSTDESFRRPLGAFSSILRVLSLLAAFAVLAFDGCVTTTQPADPILRDRVLRQYFRPEAAALLSTVPMHYGDIHGFGGMAIGDDTGSRLAAMLLGFGNARQVVIALDSDTGVVFHEYLHQAQYAGLIDTDLFRERLSVLRADPHYSGIVARWESYVRRVYGRSTAVMALAYGRGVERELLAYLIQGWMEGWYDLPGYFLEVYDRAVRLEVRNSVRRRW